MGKIGAYEPTDKYKSYSLPTTKPYTSHPFYYKQRVKTLQEQVYKKLEKIAEFLESLYPKLTDKYEKNIRLSIKKNLEILFKDLYLMKNYFEKNPYTFNTLKLKTNQNCIAEMKHICDTLQTQESHILEFKKLSKIKHVLHELEHLIHPSLSKFEKDLEKTQVKSKPKVATAKKNIPVKVPSKRKEKSAVGSKKEKPLSKKQAKPTAKLVKGIKVDHKDLQKSKVAAKAPKQSEKKLADKKALLVKSKPKIKSKSKPKIKSFNKL